MTPTTPADLDHGALGERRPPSVRLLLLSVIFFILIFGPSNLRFGMRPADASLRGDLDIFAVFDAGLWIVGGGVALLTSVHTFLPRLLGAWGPMLWTLFFACFALASTAWSMLPPYTAFFALKMPIFLGIGLSLAETARREGRDPIVWLITVFLVEHIVTLSIIVIFFFVKPEVVRTFDIFHGGYRLTGGWLGDYGRAASLTAVFCGWYAIRGRRQPWVVAGLGAMLVFALVFLVLSRTRTTMASTAIDLGLFALLARGAFVRWGWLLGAMAGAILLLSDPAVLNYINRDQQAEDIASFSGRTDAFAYLISAWQDSPLVGYGFAAGQRSWMVRYMSETGIEMGGAHDALSCVLIDLGLVGAALLLIAMAVCAWHCGTRLWRGFFAIDPSVRADAALCAALFIKICIQGVANGSMAAGSLYWLMLVIILDELRLKDAKRLAA